METSQDTPSLPDTGVLEDEVRRLEETGVSVPAGQTVRVVREEEAGPAPAPKLPKALSEDVKASGGGFPGNSPGGIAHAAGLSEKSAPERGGE